MNRFHGLSNFEQAVVLGLRDFPIVEVAERLQRSKATVYRAYLSARTKLQAGDLPELIERAGPVYLEGLALGPNGQIVVKISAAVRGRGVGR